MECSHRSIWRIRAYRENGTTSHSHRKVLI
jgi:hypothetical protein